MRNLTFIVLSVILPTGLLLAQDMKALKAIYEKNLHEISLTHDTKKSTLDKQFAKSLDGLLAKVKKSGDLKNTLAVTKEIERFKKKGMSPTPLKLRQFKDIQAIYAKQLALLRSDKKASIAHLVQKYDHALGRLQKQLVIADKLEEAKAIQNERNTFQRTVSAASTEEWLSLLAIKPASINADVKKQYYATSAKNSAGSHRLLKTSPIAKSEVNKAKHWIFMHPSNSNGLASSMYVFDRPVTQFSATLSVIKKGGDAIFSVYNDKTMVKKIHLKGYTSKDVLLELDSCKKLTLTVDKGIRFLDSWAIWIDPKVK